jgi:hypothetical protein
MSTLAPHTKNIVRRLLGEPNSDLSTKSEWRYGKKGSLAIEIAGGNAGQWFDHEAKVGGGIVDLIEREKGFSNGEVWGWLETEIGIKTESKWATTGTYVYRDRSGRPCGATPTAIPSVFIRSDTTRQAVGSSARRAA